MAYRKVSNQGEDHKDETGTSTNKRCINYQS